jgi:hypothetical protein
MSTRSILGGAADGQLVRRPPLTLVFNFTGLEFQENRRTEQITHTIMSDNFLCIIPRDPWFIPDERARVQAQQLFQKFASNAYEITSSVTDSPIFVDAGANFEAVVCPRCGQELDSWWQTIMDRTMPAQVPNLTIVTPCCAATLSLNDLRYGWPCGFARYTLEAQNPDIVMLSVGQIRALEQLLNCKLRQILIHI